MRLLGTIAANAGVAKNNTNTAAPFKIPQTVARVFLQSDVDGVQWGLGALDAFAADASAAMIPAAGIPNGPFATGQIADANRLALGNCVPAGGTGASQGGSGQTAPTTPSAVISVFNPTAGPVNVQVFAAP